MADDQAAPQEFIPYKITGQVQSQDLLPNNQFVDVMEVMFESPSGTHGTIKVPIRDYTPAETERRIEEYLDHIEGVHQLGEQPHPDNAA